MFTMPQPVLFRHCDPAGIVFYPRYFEMMNDLVEAWFDAALRRPFSRVHRHGAAVPTATITATFHAPSRHGDLLALTLAVTRLGGASMGLHMAASCEGQPRFDADSVLVNVGPDGRPLRWDDDLRATIESLTRETDAA